MTPQERVATARVRIGTSGWSYPSGKGTWNGIFYPSQPTRRPRGTPKFDELAFYAEHFDTVEVNSSFYRVPSVRTVQQWTDRTPPDFEFSLKLYQKFTHPDMFSKAGGDPATLGMRDVDEFRTAIEPLADGGKLGPLLAQFPPSFKNEPESRAYLEWLLAAFREYAIAVELRHRSWSDNPIETSALLAGFHAALARIDEPKFKSSIRQTLLPDVRGAFYYLRLHGRNAAQWWKHDSSEDRYNYLYTRNELKPFAEAASQAAREVKKAYLYANNHFSAKSVANAAILKAELGQELEGEYPPEFIEQYPELKGLVKLLPGQPRLTASRKPS